MIFVAIQLLALCIWILIFWVIIRYLFVPKAKDLKSKMIRISIGIVLMGILIGWPFWEISGKKMYYDAQVDKMCAEDGGIKVYETVTLPPEKFDKHENVGVTIKKYAKPTDEYYYELDEVVLRKTNPTLVKYTSKIIRRSDNKTLGVQIRYGRGGGDIPGPWHPSSYSCPQIKQGDKNIETSVFLKGVGK